MTEEKAKVLLVDDEPANLLALEAVLADMGHELVRALSGEEALRLLLERDFAVVLLDVQMPDLNGFETARELRGREKGRDTPIIFLTACKDDRFPVEQAYALGAVDYLFEPLLPVVLRAKVAGFVELFRKTEQVKRQAEQLRQIQRLEDERRLAGENARYRVLTEHSSDAVMLIAPDGTVVYSSPAARRVLGYETGEFLGRRGFEILHPDDQERVGAHLAELVRQPRATVTVEMQVRHKDGSWRWVECVGTNLLGEPDVGAIVVSYRDISGRKMAIEALRESEQRFARFMQHLPGLAWIKDADGRYVYANDAAVKAFRIPRTELYGKTDAEVFPPETAAQFRENDLLAISGGAGVQVVEALEHEDGLLHHSLVSKFPIPGPDGETAQGTGDGTSPRMLVGGMAIDITEQVRTRAVLEESELRFRQLAENVHAVFWMSDPVKAEVLYVSPAYEAVWGRSCRSLYEKPRSFFDAIHPEDRDRVAVQSLQRQAQGEPTDVEYRVVRPDGSVRWVRDRSFPIKGPSGRLYRVAGIAEDISEFKRAEESLKDADRRKDEFLAMLAHELRNPLAPIRNAVQVQRLLGSPDPNLQRSREMIERQVQHLTRLVDDLLDVSRITRGKVTLRKESLDLTTVIARAVETSRPLIEANRHQLTLSLPARLARVMADPTRLEQVFANLLNNAAKYTERGGHIWLTGERQGEEVLVRVRDTGFGIPAEVLPHVFDLFRQADRTLDRSQGGLGIGLTLVKSLVEMHGGGVTAHSEGHGKGSEFVVRLPVAEETGEWGEVEDGVFRSLPKGPTPLSVLVVDDNKDAADSLALLLQLWGYDVRTSNDGLSGLKAASSYLPEVVLLDIGLPGLDGYEVARRLRREFGQRMRLVAMTGYGQEEDRLRSQAAGFDAHLVKPADPACLQALLAGMRATP